MKVINEEIFNSKQALNILSSMKLPVLTSLQVAKLVSKFNEPYKVIETVKHKLITTYGQQQDNKETVVVFPNDLLGRPVSPEWEKFVSEFNELMSQEVELDIEKIKLPQEIDGKPLQIEPSILIVLEKFIEVE